VARTVEALQVARRLGAKTIALTSKPESLVGQAAGKILQMESASLPPAPGFYGYVLSMVALYLLAIRMAEVKGRLTQAGAFAVRLQLKGYIEALPRIVAAVDQTIRDLAAAWAVYDNIEFLGSGPSYAAGAFGAAKVLEASGAHASAQDLEEWAHLQYFVARPETTATFLIAPSGANAESRAVEISTFLHTLERPSLAIVGLDSPIADYHVPTLIIPERVDEPFSPLFYSIPLALFAGYLADATGAEYGRAHTGRWIDSDMGSNIRQSRIVVP
jgi:glucosamine--fructose-6-phosphate aminotransferase (isomerizing)